MKNIIRKILFGDSSNFAAEMTIHLAALRALIEEIDQLRKTVANIMEGKDGENDLSEYEKGVMSVAIPLLAKTSLILKSHNALIKMVEETKEEKKEEKEGTNYYI